MADKTKSIRKAQARAKQRLLDEGNGTTGRVTLDPTSPGGVKTDLVIRPVDIDLDGTPIIETLPSEALNDIMGHEPGAPLGFWGAGEAKFDLWLTREDTDDLLRLRGDVLWPVAHSCVRCLEPVAFTLDFELDLRLFPGRGELLAGESVDLDPQNLRAVTDDDDDEFAQSLTEDEDFVLYPPAGVDVLAVLREQAFLELPAHPTCDHRSADRPTPCLPDTMDRAREEAARWQDPRWDALRALSDRLKN